MGSGTLGPVSDRLSDGRDLSMRRRLQGGSPGCNSFGKKVLRRPESYDKVMGA